MRGRFFARIGVQTPQTQDHLGLIGPLGHQVGSALIAKMPDLPRRRFEVAKKFLASTPFEVRPLRASGGRECCAVRFSASLAIAMNNRPRKPLGLECYRATKTASVKHLNFLQAVNDRLPSVLRLEDDFIAMSVRRGEFVGKGHHWNRCAFEYAFGARTMSVLCAILPRATFCPRSVAASSRHTLG